MSDNPEEPVVPESDKEKLAKENAAETAEAYRLAAEHRAQDVQYGAAVPPVQAVAASLREKLVNEEFQKPIPSVETPPVV